MRGRHEEAANIWCLTGLSETLSRRRNAEFVVMGLTKEQKQAREAEMMRDALGAVRLRLVEHYRVGGEKAEAATQAKNNDLPSRFIGAVSDAFNQDALDLGWDDIKQAIEDAGKKQWLFHFKRLGESVVAAHEPDLTSRNRKRPSKSRTDV